MGWMARFMVSIAGVVVVFIVLFEILNVGTPKEIVFIAFMAIGVGFIANLVYGVTRRFPTKRRRLEARTRLFVKRA